MKLQYICHAHSNARCKRRNCDYIYKSCHEIVMLYNDFFCRFLAAGDTLRSSSFNFLTGRSTSCEIIAEVCQAIWDIIGPLYAVLPSTPAEWKKVIQ